MSVHRISESALTRLQNWYSSQCDEDWEHSHGVKIDTLDNPGWMLTIDLVDTELASRSMQREIVQRTKENWIQREIGDGKYLACGGPHNLEEMVEAFLSFAEDQKHREE